MKILYITVMLPHGTKEAFFIPEIRELLRAGHEVLITPVRKPGPIMHEDARELGGITRSLALFHARVLAAFVTECVQRPRRVSRSLRLLLGNSRSVGIAAKNLTVLPKAMWIARIARSFGADHIHAQWAGTTATAGFVASTITGTPWSFTAHRWDIRENNALALKAASARLIRAIGEAGARELRSIAGVHAPKVHVIHMGVSPEQAQCTVSRHRDRLRVVVAANLVDVKGHAYLLDAVAQLAGRDVALSLDIVGDGPLREELQRRVATLRLEDSVSFLGVMSHGTLLEKLRRPEWDVMVLPSIVTDSGVQEGIPVSLMEAMACGVPVVSTRTGSIPELLEGGAGTLVPQRDPSALAAALQGLLDPAARERSVKAGAERIARDFNVRSSIQRFVAAIS